MFLNFNRSSRDEPSSYSSSRNYRSMQNFQSTNTYTLSSSRYTDRYRNSYQPLSFQPSISSIPSSSSHHNGPVYENGVLVSTSSTRHDFNTSAPPIRNFNKFNGRPPQRYNRQPTFERRNRSDLPHIRNWRCPKREL